MKTNHTQLIVKLNYMLIKHKGVKDPMTLVNMIMELGFDNITDGFWVWEMDSGREFYSPRFRKILGFDGEKDFPSTSESWQAAIDPKYTKMAIEAYEAHRRDAKNPYVLDVVYNRKDGTKAALICSGTIVNRGEDVEFMIGTHELTSFFM